MKTTSSVKIHTTVLFTVAALLLVPGFLSTSGVTGPLPGMPKAWYWAGALAPLICGLISFSGGLYCYRSKRIDALSKVALWLGFLSLYLLVIVWGMNVRQIVSGSSLVSGAVIYASRFAVPLLAAWLLGVKPALPLALLPTIIQLANVSRYPESAGYIIFSAIGCLISVAVFVAEPFKLIGGGRLCAVLMVLCAALDAFFAQMIFNVLAVRTVDSSVPIGVLQFIPVIAMSLLLHLLSKRNSKEKAGQV